jgi:hypothetical protein
VLLPVGVLLLPGSGVPGIGKGAGAFSTLTGASLTADSGTGDPVTSGVGRAEDVTATVGAENDVVGVERPRVELAAAVVTGEVGRAVVVDRDVGRDTLRVLAENDTAGFEGASSALILGEVPPARFRLRSQPKHAPRVKRNTPTATAAIHTPPMITPSRMIGSREVTCAP